MRSLFALPVFALLSSISAAATYTVDNLGDSAIQSACTAAANDCSLRGAISRANADAALDTVDFNIPTALCGATCLITATQQISIDQPIVIDGSTQPGYVANIIPAQDGPINTVWSIEMRLLGNFVLNNSTMLRGLVITRGQLNTGSTSNPVPSIVVEGCFIGDPTDYINSASLTASSQSVRIGGLLANQRNVLVANLSAHTTVGQSLIQGNLIGAAPNATTMYFDDNFNQTFGSSINLSISGTAEMLIGGTDPGARNIVALRSPAFSALSTSTNPIRIKGNSFGIGANGVRFVTCGIAGAVNAEVGGLEPGAGNQFGSYVTLPFGRQCGASEAIRMSGTGSFLSNSVDGRATLGITNNGNGLNQIGYLPNDVNDADFGLQNTPEIIAFNNAGNQVNLTYGIDSTTTNSNYPLTVQFFISENRNPKTLLFTDTYTAANAQQAKSINFTLPAGVSLSSTDVIVGIANGSNLGGPSLASFYPMTYSFVGTPQLLVNTPSPIRIRATTTGPFFPRGQALVTIGISNCLATLIPTSTAGVSEGVCSLTPEGPFGYLLRASAGGYPEPFSAPMIQANVTAVIDKMLCDGFENPLRCQ
jgi:hypothetical protein